ncbi:hypothetical protein BAUCODRAFT_121559 [Baudoinia panamericana UAMH 10762]|uniref:Major facilitator superfamily (MFS) profile domain-containing protein n=1 Tax=Baudoinia panamericana (strain UAMH 10762) TaxID=717646 RepID=M2LRH6_BAUPA|nr:uncharacterized protein BAUCODRAFT_121559 [Baudoinia panamericana UAMH 10762]EMC97042.1 hypothetical protein BAUCODRAFT_121559 [Baudoinia panamericana UAMH 10762]
MGSYAPLPPIKAPTTLSSLQPLLDAVLSSPPPCRSSSERRVGSEKARDNDAGEASANIELDEESEDDSAYVSGVKLAFLTLGLCLATFVITLDNTIIATASPRITTTFDSLKDVGWYSSSYLLTTTALQPSFGKVNAYFSVKWVWLSALIVFEVGSILCATAISSKMFIVGRAVAGVGAVAIFSGGMTILAYAISLKSRPMYLGIVSSMFGIASVVGPILGGAFTDSHLTWRWCFWINVPFGGAAALTVLSFFSEPLLQYKSMALKDKLKQIDFVGAVLLIAAIGGVQYPWHDSRVWDCLLGFGLLITVFCITQAFLGDRATMPPRIHLRQRTVGACALFSAFLAMALYTHLYYLPFYFQAVKGVSAKVSGIHMIPYLVSMTVASIAAGGITTTVGYYNPPMWFGISLFAVGAGLLYTLKVSTSESHWIGYEIVAGFGMGSSAKIPFTATKVVLSKRDMPIGNAVVSTAKSKGYPRVTETELTPVPTMHRPYSLTRLAALSVSIAENVFTNTLVKQVARDAPSVNPQSIVYAGATQLRSIISAQQLPAVLVAYDKAVTAAVILPIACAVLAFLSSLLMEWKSVKGMKLM